MTPPRYVFAAGPAPTSEPCPDEGAPVPIEYSASGVPAGSVSLVGGERRSDRNQEAVETILDSYYYIA